MSVEYKVVPQESGFVVHCYNNNQFVALITKCDNIPFDTEQEAIDKVKELTS